MTKKRKFYYPDGGNLNYMESSMATMPEGTTDLVLSPERQKQLMQNSTQSGQSKDFSLGAFSPVGMEETPISGNRMIDQATAGMAKDKMLRKNIVGGIGSASKLLDLVVPGLGTGLSTGINAANSFAKGGNMITEIPGSAGTHDSNPNNGVNIDNYDSSVEGDETIDNKNKFVFSNRLRPNGSKKSYADLTKPLNKKLGFRPDDKLTKDYVQGEMDRLAEDQEAQKEYMNIMNQAKMLYGGMMKNYKPYGGGLTLPAMAKDTIINKNPYRVLPNGQTIPVYNPNQLVTKTDNLSDNLGTKLPYSYDSINVNTPTVPNDFTGKLPVMAPDASVLFPDVFKQKSKGGKLRRMDKGGSLDELYEKYKNSASGEFESKDSLIATDRFNEGYLNTLLGNPSNPNDPQYSGANPNYTKPQSKTALGMVPYQFSQSSPQLDNFKPNGSTISSNKKQVDLGQGYYNYLQNKSQKATVPEDSSTGKSTVNPSTNRSFKGSKAVPFTQLLGPASQMITSLAQRNKDLSNLNYRTPEYTPVDEFYAAKLAEQGQDRIAATTANAIRGAATDQGTYLAAMLGANSAMLGSPNQPANLAYDAMKTNVAGRNQNAQIKAGIQNQNIDEREKLLDNSREEFTNSLYNAGAAGSGIYKDIKQGQQDLVNNEMFTKNYGNIFSNLELNPDGTIRVKKAAKYGGKMKKR